MLACLEAAGGAAVARERLDGVVQRPLDLRMELFVLEFFFCQPLGCCHQGLLFVQMPDIPLPCRGRIGGVQCLQATMPSSTSSDGAWA